MVDVEFMSFWFVVIVVGPPTIYVYINDDDLLKDGDSVCTALP